MDSVENITHSFKRIQDLKEIFRNTLSDNKSNFSQHQKAEVIMQVSSLHTNLNKMALKWKSYDDPENEELLQKLEDSCHDLLTSVSAVNLESKNASLLGCFIHVQLDAFINHLQNLDNYISATLVEPFAIAVRENPNKYIIGTTDGKVHSFDYVEPFDDEYAVLIEKDSTLKVHYPQKLTDSLLLLPQITTNP